LVAPKPEPVIPHAYVMHNSTTVCSHCGHESHTTQFYALSFIRSRMTNERVRNLTPCTRPLFNLPVERVNLTRTSTPYCALCPSVDLSHLPPPPEASKLRTMVEPERRGAPAATKKPPSRPSVFDLA
jgi:hypothetical protein